MNVRKSAAIGCSACLALGGWLWLDVGGSQQAPDNASHAADSVPVDASQEPDSLAREVENDSGSAAGSAVDARTRHINWLNYNLELQRAELRDAHRRGELKSRHRTALVQINPGLADFIGLSAEEADRLFDVLAEQHLRQLEAAHSTWINGKLNSDALAEVHRNTELQRPSNEAELAQLLGAERYEKYRAYMSPTGQTRTIRDIGAALRASHLPLDEEQGRQMLALLDDSAAHPDVETLADIDNELDRLAQIDERNLQMLSPVLSESQLQIVVRVQDEKIATYRANRDALKAQASPGPSDSLADSQESPASASGFVLLDPP